jgi:recombination associated protein RdgC
MWFRNITFFRFSGTYSLTFETLIGELKRYTFEPCPIYQLSATGWVPPLGRGTDSLAHAVADRLLFCLRTEEKLLPASVLNQMVTERIAVIEDKQQRQVGRREKQKLRDQLLDELLPNALIRFRQNYAYLDIPGGWLVVDSANSQMVEKVTGFLRKTLGTLLITPIKVNQSTSLVMTNWLSQGRSPQGLSFGDRCELRGIGANSSVVTCQSQDLTSDEVRVHIESGKKVTKLGLVWNERIAFVLDETFVIRRMQFLNLVKESLGDCYNDSKNAICEAEYSIMIGELAILLPRLLELFGGEAI